MDELHLSSWADFPQAIERINKERRGTIFSTPTLYRGQASSEWELATTLERRAKDRFTVAKYVQLATRHAHEVASRTGKTWPTQDYLSLRQEIEERSHGMQIHIPSYEYLVYLRQLGFSSPLLDWTASPYVAAYFAFCDPVRQQSTVAVYAYIEAPQGIKGGSVGDSAIRVMGPHINTHPRHYTQQAWYTIATDTGHERPSFCPHSSVFSKSDPDQDVLVKITIPVFYRNEALRFLQSVNITHYTLFQTDEALVRTLDIREFDLGYP